MTNREKYVNNADIVDLYNLLDWQKVENKFGIKINGTNDIYKWLSQEAEEDIVNVPHIGKMPKTDKITSDYEKLEIIQLTKEAYKDILGRLGKLEDSKNDIRPLIETDKNIGMLIKEIVALQERVKELEKCSKCPKNNDIQLSGYNHGSIEKEKTADVMFEELGYKKVNKSERIVIYTNNRFDIIINEDIEEEKKYIYTKLAKQGNGVGITEAEDKAIHEKIAELRLESENHIVGDIVDGKVLCSDGAWQEYR